MFLKKILDDYNKNCHLENITNKTRETLKTKRMTSFLH